MPKVKVVTHLRKVAAGLGALAAAAGLAGGASAQLATGRSGFTTIQSSDDQALREVVRFGRCFALSRRNDSLSLIATQPGSREEAEAFHRLVFFEDQICLAAGSRLGAPIIYMRGAIAEGLLRSGQPLPASHQLPIPAVSEVRSLSDLARCYAAAHREQVRALLATRPGSRQESEAVSAMASEFGTCMPARASLRYDSTQVRYRLIEALLRLAPAPAAAPGN
jgi:hypothetical protein